MKIRTSEGVREVPDDALSVTASTVASVLAELQRDDEWPLDILAEEDDAAQHFIERMQPAFQFEGSAHVFVLMPSEGWVRAAVGYLDGRDPPEPPNPDDAPPVVEDAPRTEPEASPDAPEELAAPHLRARVADLASADDPRDLVWSLVIDTDRPSAAFAEALAVACTGVEGQGEDAAREHARYVGPGLDDLVVRVEGRLGIACPTPGVPDACSVRISLARRPTPVELKHVFTRAPVFAVRRQALGEPLAIMGVYLDPQRRSALAPSVLPTDVAGASDDAPATPDAP